MRHTLFLRHVVSVTNKTTRAIVYDYGDDDNGGGSGGD